MINPPGVSVIIAARNEIQNLQTFLPSVLEQNYPNFEVIVVNDNSFDGTRDYLAGLQEKYAHLKVVLLEQEERLQKGKKFAITLGIKAASFDTLLFTDADCQPNSPNWISSMIAQKENKGILLGVSPFFKINKWWNGILRYENFHTALNYLGYAERNLTYMGVARNLMYDKNLFFSNKGFARHQHILSGDDDLLIQDIATKNNVGYTLATETLVHTVAPPSFKAWVKQKRRHQSTAKYYKPKFKFLLGLYAASQIIFVLLLPFLFSILPFSLANLLQMEPVIILIGIASTVFLKWLIQFLIFYKTAKSLKQETILYFLPFYDVLFSVYLTIFAVLSLTKNKIYWK